MGKQKSFLISGYVGEEAQAQDAVDGPVMMTKAAVDPQQLGEYQ